MKGVFFVVFLQGGDYILSGKQIKFNVFTGRPYSELSLKLPERQERHTPKNVFIEYCLYPKCACLCRGYVIGVGVHMYK